jgi:hypothetical protein
VLDLRRNWEAEHRQDGLTAAAVCEATAGRAQIADPEPPLGQRWNIKPSKRDGDQPRDANRRWYVLSGHVSEGGVTLELARMTPAQAIAVVKLLNET